MSWSLARDLPPGSFSMVAEEVLRNPSSDGSIGFFLRASPWSCLPCCDSTTLTNNSKALVIGFRGAADGGRGTNAGADNAVSE